MRIPREQRLHNTDFSDASYGDPAWWCYSITPGMTVDADGKNGLRLTNLRPEEGEPKARSANTFRFRREVPQRHLGGHFELPRRQSGETGRGRRGLLIAVNYNGGNLHYAETTRKQDLEGDGARQLRTFDFKIPPRATYLDLRIGLGAHTTGTVQVERVELMLNQ